MTVKKVVIAAAGQGTRMLKLSETRSKHLINVNQRPFLAYLLDNLFIAGYREIILVIGFKNELMEQFVKDYSPPNGIRKDDFKIILVNHTEILGPKEKIYGTACPVMCIKDIIGKENFIYVYGDNLFSVDDLKSMNIDDDFIYIGGIKNEHPEKYGVLIEEGGFLKEIIEKPKEFIGNLINTSPFKFTPEIFDKIPQLKKSPRGEYEITDLINILAAEKKVKVKELKDFWQDFGNPEDIEKVSKFLKDESCEYPK
jgi:NDP-sugar pyrophosphorylase family protein